MPDFRVVLDSNEQRLIEVKSHFPSDPRRPLRIPCRYVDALRRYAELFDTPLKLAIYWARWNLWTLVDHARLSSSGRYSEIGLEEAMMRNEMSDLGDVTIGTRYPLELRLLASTTAPRTVEGDYVSMRVAGYEVRCAGVPVTRPEEKRLAIYLMMFGKWPETEALVEFDDDGLPTAAVHQIEPEVKNEGQGFEMIGALSSLFSKFYNFSTMEGGKVARLLRFDDLSRIEPIVPKDYHGQALPLWRFRLQPATD